MISVTVGSVGVATTEFYIGSAWRVSNLVDKSPNSTLPTPKAEDATGGGLSAPLKREYD